MVERPAFVAASRGKGDGAVGMPDYPDGSRRPGWNETIIDLMESIALEEMALAHLVNAEAEQLQAFVGEALDFPTRPSNGDILRFNAALARVLETLMFKELFLLRKLETAALLRSAAEEEE